MVTPQREVQRLDRRLVAVEPAEHVRVQTIDRDHSVRTIPDRPHSRAFGINIWSRDRGPRDQKQQHMNTHGRSIVSRLSSPP